MKYVRILLISLFINFLLVGTIFADENKNENVTFLYIELASTGTFEKNNNNTYTLTLEGVNPWITYFTLTPKRSTGILHVNDFNKVLLHEIKKSIEKSPKGLNTGLVARDFSDEHTLSYTVSLKDPVYNAKDNKVTYIANLIPGLQASKIPNKITFNHVSLFIDACPSCGAH